ncbi:MAG: peptide ABC transporter substrate-binding protein [Deltaproteobacteria bacterium]|nr:peptide ABC transporter substrate-binding protein [Deltaproteobacteria bacterium]
MTIKRILILGPTVIIIFMLQSYFWVPTYEEQTRGNPNRLTEYITASSGDATLLNPILSADSASSQIESMVFEGLIDRDKDLHFRGRLARSWEIHEEAYFYVYHHNQNKNQDRPAHTNCQDSVKEAKRIVGLIKKAMGHPKNLNTHLQTTLNNIKKISIIPPENLHKHLTDKKKETVEIHAPAQIKLTLNRVDQDLFKNLQELIGKGYFSGFPSEKYISPHTPKKIPRAIARSILPAIGHNPVITFHLRGNVRFHDGVLFSAKDVKFTYEAIMDPKNLSPRVSDFEPVKSIQVVDPLTVRIVYRRLYSPALGTWSIGILPEHLLNKNALSKEKHGLNKKDISIRQSSFNRHPVGCGPFRFTEWKPDQYIRLDRFKDYWEAPPNYHSYIVRIIPDPLTQEMEFYAGTLDHYNVQPHQVERFKHDSRFQIFFGTSFGYTYIGYNMRRKPFNDRRVRTALGMAIDVNKIIKYVLYGQGERISGPFAKQTDFYDKDVSPLPYDPKGALRLLNEAGWRQDKDGWLEKNGKRLEFTLITNNGNDLRKAILAIVQDEWKKIGVKVHTDLLEWSVFIQERIDKADFDAVILGWSMGIEPDMYQIWHSSQSHPGQLNFVGFKNRQADELIVKIRQEYNHKKQVEYCHQLHRLIAREQPYTFLYLSKWAAVLDKRIVIKRVDKNNQIHYEKIRPSKTGNYSYDFNKWIKLPVVPQLAIEQK